MRLAVGLMLLYTGNCVKFMNVVGISRLFSPLSCQKCRVGSGALGKREVGFLLICLSQWTRGNSRIFFWGGFLTGFDVSRLRTRKLGYVRQGNSILGFSVEQRSIFLLFCSTFSPVYIFPPSLRVIRVRMPTWGVGTREY